MQGDPHIRLPSDQSEQGDAAAQVGRRVVTTQGGDYAEGSIDKRQGTFVEGGLSITEERAYTVAGLLNPYLGLRAFTAAEHDIFAGRERMIRALVERLSADDGDRLLFIVGASGSGKSSLARAGLLPALAECLTARSHAIEHQYIDHPGHLPATTFASAINGAQASPVPRSPRFLLLLIDQFEEIFSQTIGDERERALTLLANLAAQPNLPMRIVITMRNDFLPQLVADARFEAAERRKVVLRAMHSDELMDAIQRPLQVRYPEKRIEPALIQRLATDAAADVAYLPLLQVTLEDLWRRGELRLGHYHGLADAIQRRANAVYTYADYDGLQQELRTPEEQATILAVFLDLVRVSLDGEQRDVRWRRTRLELCHGDPLREQLITELASARLLHTDREAWHGGHQYQEVETVDIVHEALLTGWKTLNDSIEKERERLHRRVRFDLALNEWCDRQRSDTYLLTGVWLAEAEDLHQQDDIAFRQDSARELLAGSIALREAERRKDDEEKIRRAADQRSVRMLRTFLVVAGLLLLLTFVSIGYALWSQQALAEQVKQTERDIADAQHIASQAQAEIVVGKFDQAALHVRASIRTPEYAELPVIRVALRRIFENINPELTVPQKSHVVSVAWSPDGTHMLTGSQDAHAQIWNARTGSIEHDLRGHEAAVWSVAWSPDSKQVLTGSWDHTVRIWDGASGAQVLRLDETERVWSVTWSPDGRQILVGTWDGAVHIYDVPTGVLHARLEECLPTSNDDQAVLSVAWKPDGQQVAAGRNDGNVCIWNAATGRLAVTFKATGREVRSLSWNAAKTQLLTSSIDNLASTWDATDGHLLHQFIGHTGPVRSAAWSPHGDRIVTASSDATARIWDVATGAEIGIFTEHGADVWAVAWHPTRELVLTGSYDTTARVWVTDSQFMVAKLTQTICERFTDDQIRADIPAWRGCAQEMQSIHP